MSFDTMTGNPSQFRKFATFFNLEHWLFLISFLLVDTKSFIFFQKAL